MNLVPRRFGLRKRLVVLVLVPAVLLAFVSGAAADREAGNARVLRSVRDRARILSGLTELGSELLAARGPAEVQVRAAEVGIDAGVALAVVGIEPAGAAPLAAVLGRLRDLPADARPFSTARVARLQRSVVEGPDQATIDEFDALDALARATWERNDAALRDDVVRAGDVDLSHRLDDLEAATGAGAAAAHLLTGSSGFWFSAPDPDRSAASLVALVQASRDLDAALAQLASSTDPSVAARGRSLARAIAASPLRSSVDDALVASVPGGPGAPAIDVGALVAAFTDSFDRVQPLPGLIRGRAEALQHLADAEAAAASGSARSTLLGAAAAIALLLTGSVLVGASFERPLSRLIAATRRIGSGDLAVEPLPEDGPEELAEASAAFNEVVVTLRRQENLEYLASHDALTGLHNRAWADVALDDALARAERSGAVVGVAFLDLDRFKAVNDSYGHAAGDEVLRAIGERLRKQARAGDICARIGGDEFLVVAEGTDPAAALAMAHRMGAVIEEPVLVAGIELDVGVSIGLALGRPGDRASELLARADLAAYRAKRDGTRVVRWRPELADDEARVIALLPESDVARTIDV